jgi:HEPN domain-containing protein
MSDQKHEPELWIIKGDHDLGTARITNKHIPEFLDTVTFHCQQAAEKYLKAYLIYLSVPFRFTHDLIYLLDIICESDPDVMKYYDALSELQSYAVEIRYPNETIYLTQEKVEKALLTSTEIRQMVLSKIGLNIPGHPIIEE